MSASVSHQQKPETFLARRHTAPGELGTATAGHAGTSRSRKTLVRPTLGSDCSLQGTRSLLALDQLFPI